jgi:hypothetical protein
MNAAMIRRAGRVAGPVLALVKIPQMVRAGVMLNLAGIALVTVFAYLVIGPLLAGRP